MKVSFVSKVKSGIRLRPKKRIIHQMQQLIFLSLFSGISPTLRE